jgi:hypothetical protein
MIQSSQDFMLQPAQHEQVYSTTLTRNAAKHGVPLRIEERFLAYL